jgi:hypothetical protein
MEQFFRSNGVPEKDIAEKIPKIKLVRSGTIESLTFVINKNNF